MKLLFVCLAASQRSPTAAGLVNEAGKHEARFAGVDPFADVHISLDLVKWADRIFVMEPYMKKHIEEKFPYEDADIDVLNIPDVYRKNDPRLVAILKEKLSEYL